MNTDEVKQLLKFVVVDDHRTIGEIDAKWWAARLQDVPLQQAIDAMIRFRDENPGKWLEIGHIKQGVRVIRNEVIQRSSRIDELVPNVDPDRWAEYIAERRAILTAAGDGRLDPDHYRDSGLPLTAATPMKAIGSAGPPVTDAASFRAMFPRRDRRMEDCDLSEAHRRALARKKAEEIAKLNARYARTA